MAKGYIYFIGGAGRVKVGHTVDFETRFATLQTCNADELKVIAAVEAPRTSERPILTLLAPYNIRGEWFYDCPPLRAVIARVKAGEFFEIIDGVQPRLPMDEQVRWAGDALRTIAHPRHPDETAKDMIERVSELLGWKRSRTFELWYRKARRLEVSERNKIESMLEVRDGLLESAA